MKFKKIFIVSLLLIALLSISASFASDISDASDDICADSLNNVATDSSTSLSSDSSSSLSSDSSLNNIETNDLDKEKDNNDAKILGIFITNDTDLRNFDSDVSEDPSSNLYGAVDSDADSNLDINDVHESSQNNMADSEDGIEGPNLDTDFIDLDVTLSNNNTIYVNGSYTGSTESGTQEAPYKSVNTAFGKLTNTKKNLFIAEGSYELSSYLSVTRSVNIIGENALNTILSIKTSSELLFVKSNNLLVNIFNLTFTKGSSDSGGAIYSNRSTVNIVNSIFKENSAIEKSTYYSTYYACGGAIFNEAGDMRLYNCTFVNNTASGYEDSYAAAIYNYMGDISVLSSQFINNTIKAGYGTGGAIYTYGGFLTVFNSTFINTTINSNASLGGAISSWHANNIYVLNSSFKENKIYGEYTFGSAIANDAVYFYVENSTFTDNLADGIGVENETVFNMHGNYYFINSIMENNTLTSANNSFLMALEDQFIIQDIYDGSIELPSSYDLRDEGLLTPITDQGSTGSCWAFATIAALESYLLKTENVSYDFSEQNMRNLMNYYGVNGTDLSDGGNHFMSLAYLLRWSGPINESDDPFNSYSSRSSYNLDRVRHVQDVLFVPLRNGYLDNDQIKYAILKYGALYTTFSADSTFQYNKNYYLNWADYSNHAVALVGWDDNYPASNFGTYAPPGDGAFIIKNSWGTTYGESGYWYISYYDKTMAGYGIDTVSGVAFTNVENVTNYKDIYQYDILGNTFDSLGYNSNTAWFANQFSSTSDNPLAAFSFYSYGDSTIDAEILVNGLSVHNQSANVIGAGYHTIKLDKLVNLVVGDIFRINVKITTPDSKFPIAIESQRSGYSSKATASLGQSFVSPDGESWYDISRNTDAIKFYEFIRSNNTLYKTNVCLKAYTAYAGNLVLNIDANTSLYLKGDSVEFTFNVSNIGDFIGDINISINFDDTVLRDSIVNISKGTFDGYNDVWVIDSLNAGESAILKLRVKLTDNKDVIENFALISTSGFNAGSTGLQYFYLYSSSLTKFLDIEDVSTLARSNDEVVITLVDALTRPIANKNISVILGGENLGSYKTNRNGTVSINLDLIEGNYTYLILFEGDNDFEASNMTFNVNVTKRSSHITIENSNGTITVLSLSDDEILIDLFDVTDSPIANHTISVYVTELDKYYETLTDLNGVARFNLNLLEGDYLLKLLFDGDDVYASSDLEFNVNVIKRASPIILVGNDLLNLTDEFTVCLVARDFSLLADKTICLKLIDGSGNAREYNLTTDDKGVARLDKLAVGKYIVSGTFANDDEYYDASFNPVIISILGLPTVIEADNIDKYYSNGTDLIAKLTLSNGTAIVQKPIKITIRNNDGGDELVYNLESDENGLISLALNDILEGDYIANIVFASFENYASSSKVVNITIHNPIINMENDTIDLGDDVVLTFLDYDNNPLAEVLAVISINQTILNKTTDSHGQVFISNLEDGIYNVSASFADIDKYGIYSNGWELNVLKSNDTSSNESSVNGTDVNGTGGNGSGPVGPSNGTDVNGTGTNDTNGSSENQTVLGSQDLQKLIDNAAAGSTLVLANATYENVSNIRIDKNITIIGENATIISAADGNPIFKLSTVSEGLEEVQIKGINFLVDNGDTVLLAKAENGSNPLSIETAKIDFVGNDISSSNDNFVGESVNVLVLQSERTNLAPTNPINISGNTLESGISPFRFDITSVSNATDAFIPSGVNVPEKQASVLNYKDMVTTAFDSALEGRIGEYFIVTLTDGKGNPLVNKSVQIGFNGAIYNRTTNESGKVRLQINLGYAGKYTFAVSFLGDEEYNGSFVVALITVNKQNAKLTAPNKTYKASAKTKTLTATFKSNSGKAISGKKISFTVNGKTYTVTTNSKGVASVKVSLSTKKSYSFTAKYAGDDRYAAVSAKGTVKIE